MSADDPLRRMDGGGIADAVPFNDPRLADGRRFRAVLGTPPSPGTCISLRVPAGRGFFARRLCRLGLLDARCRATLARMIVANLAFLISGGTGSGKTTLRLRHH